MKCHTCGKVMEYKKELQFNEHTIDGWKCKCGEMYYNPEQAQKILLFHKLKKEIIKAKLGRIRSNLIVRLPKGLEQAYNLEQGEDVLIKLEKDGFKIVPA